MNIKIYYFKLKNISLYIFFRKTHSLLLILLINTTKHLFVFHTLKSMGKVIFSAYNLQTFKSLAINFNYLELESYFMFSFYTV